MRLIDEDLLIQDLHHGIFDDCDCKKDYEYLGIDDYIRNQPAAFDVGKVIAELEQQKDQYFRRGKEIEEKFGENYESQKNFSKACSYDHALEIFKSAANATNGKIGGGGNEKIQRHIHN